MSSVEEAISLSLQGLRDPHMVTRLYFCGTLERPNRIPNILSNGFSDEGNAFMLLNIEYKFKIIKNGTMHFIRLNGAVNVLVEFIGEWKFC